MDSGGVQEGWSALHRLLKKRLKPFNHLPVQHPENCRNPWSSDELGLGLFVKLFERFSLRSSQMG
jgi:hypothetical protein